MNQRDLLTLIEMNLPSNEEKLELVKELFLHHHADLSFLHTTSSNYSPHEVDKNYLERGRRSSTAVELQPREIEQRQGSSSSRSTAGGERTKRIRSTSTSTSSPPGRTTSNYHGARTTTTSGAPLGHQQASSTTLCGDASQQAVVPPSPAQEFPTGVEVVPAALTGAPQLSPSRTGFGERRQIGVFIKVKTAPTPYQNEISDAGFAYTNQMCLAVGDFRPIPCQCTEVLAYALSMGNVYAVGPTALQAACIMGRSPCHCFLARQTRFDVVNQHHKFSEAFLFDMGRGDFSLR